MNLGTSSNLYLTMMYVYLKAYEAIGDFEDEVKDAGYPDIALMSVKQKYREKIDRFAGEIST
jgi:hypothetical protein